MLELQEFGCQRESNTDRTRICSVLAANMIEARVTDVGSWRSRRPLGLLLQRTGQPFAGRAGPLVLAPAWPDIAVPNPIEQLRPARRLCEAGSGLQQSRKG